MNLKAIELYYLIKLLNNYEIGIVNKITFYSKTYSFNNDKELRIAVKLWNNDKSICINKYGHISHWDVSKITNMAKLFSSMENFNEDISRWNTTNVKDMRYERYVFLLCKIQSPIK
jgi:surface protein